jgi:chromosome segregation ATPase
MEWIKINLARILTISLLAAGIIGLTVLFIPSGMVQAARLGEPTPPPDDEGARAVVLEKAYQRTVKAYQRQEKLFTGMDKLQTRLEKLIERAKENGKDTSGLEAALDNAGTIVTTAREAYDRAGSILDTHTGYDADGKVTDADAAKATLEEARTALTQARETLGGAMKELKEAFKAFREANPKPVATTEPAPIS